MEKRYIGKWIPTKSTENDIVVMWILPFNENEYYIEIRGNTDDEVGRIRAYLTVIDNVHILNVQQISEGDQIIYMPRDYWFLKISLSDNDVLTLWDVEDNGLKSKDHSKEELLQYIQRNIRNDNIFDKLDVFKRQKRI